MSSTVRLPCTRLGCASDVTVLPPFLMKCSVRRIDGLGASLTFDCCHDHDLRSLCGETPAIPFAYIRQSPTFPSTRRKLFRPAVMDEILNVSKQEKQFHAIGSLERMADYLQNYSA